MKIIPLNCPSCGARLEIGENKEQLACGTCGSQLYVDCSGGTISLELAKSLGAISTGASQTAAELALVRLEKELKQTSYEAERLQKVLQEETSNLRNHPFEAEDLMSDEARVQLRKHRTAIENRKIQEESNFRISQANERLPDVQDSIARIEAEITHNKKIVSLKH